MDVAVGNGKVLLLGTVPEEKELRRIISKTVNEFGGDKFNTTGGVIVVRREGKNLSGLIAADVSGTGGTFNFNGKMKDILTDKVYEDYISLEPYTTAILVKI